MTAQLCPGCGDAAHGRGAECCPEMLVTPSIEASEPLGPCGCGSEPDEEESDGPTSDSVPGPAAGDDAVVLRPGVAPGVVR